MSRGKYGAPSRLVTRKMLRPRQRPEGQCAECFVSGLSHDLSARVCPDCRPDNRAYRAEQIITARKHAS